MTLYIAACSADRHLARVWARELGLYGFSVVEGGDWWNWKDDPDDATWQIRVEHAICQAGRVLVLRSSFTHLQTGAEAAYAKSQGLPVFWCDLDTEIRRDPWLTRHGVRVENAHHLLLWVQANG